jgi:hypothetical protein
MNIVSEKRKVVGTISTLVGRYSLLSMTASPSRGLDGKGLWFEVVDDEGFANQALVSGDFVLIPAQVSTMVDVRVVPSEEVVQEIVTFETID